MKTDLEKQFFSTFGIEPDVESCYRSRYHKCDTKSYQNCKDCDKSTLTYPQITDRILLQLLVIINDFYFRIDSMEELKEVILKECIKWADKYKHQVQELFKEER